LELQINPPESDPQVIESAIKRKQAEWSRLRNHPTKGTQARQYISLLTEIRNVMGDPQLRKEEALNALENLKKKLGAKFKVIDSHVFLLGSKGEITQDEVSRLAQHHKVKPQIIQRRVDRWGKKHGTALETHLNRLLIYGKPDEKMVEKIALQFDTSTEETRKVIDKLLEERTREIDAYINIQIRKGYMSEKEISSLAALYSFDQGEILRHIRCPIKKASDSEIESAYQLDGTIEQVIGENLKILGLDSLYSFLGLFPGSPLEALQKKAIEKENDIRKIAQKDAIVTASGVLAGQCISIFKTDENRYAYDLSRARSLLRQLNQEIGLTVNKKSIRLEYFHYLLRKAVSFGTAPDEARQHILDYCQSKKWRVELPKKQRNLKRYAQVAITTLGVLLIAGSVFWYFYFSNQRLEDEYARTAAEAGKQQTLEAQIRVFQNYISRHDQDEFRQRAANQIEALEKRVVQRNYKKIIQETEGLYAEKRYEEIDTLYNQFLSRHGGSAWADKIREQAAKLPALIDERDFDNLLNIPSDKPEEIAHAGTAYLRQHPEGNHVSQVKQIIANVEADYYKNLNRTLQDHEKTGNWPQCIALATRFIDVYRDSSLALGLKERRDRYQINLQNRNILNALMAKAGGPEADPSSIRSVFDEFLRESPNSPAAELVRSKLAEVNQKLGRREAQLESDELSRLFAKKGGRFSIKKQGTFQDKKTGLTWTLLDSRLAEGKCMTYNEARRHAANMKLGGYSDWRLPKAKELEILHASPTPFPGSTSAWYWSSDSFKRYSGGWIILVDVFRPLPQPSIRKQDSKGCGWFRAVRP
jgi:hypothetical protein